MILANNNPSSKNTFSTKFHGKPHGPLNTSHIWTTYLLIHFSKFQPLLSLNSIFLLYQMHVPLSSILCLHPPLIFLQNVSIWFCSQQISPHRVFPHGEFSLPSPCQGTLMLPEDKSILSFSSAHSFNLKSPVSTHMRGQRARADTRILLTTEFVLFNPIKTHPPSFLSILSSYIRLHLVLAARTKILLYSLKPFILVSKPSLTF